MPVGVLTRVHNEETSAQFDPIPSYGAILRRSCYPLYLAAERTYEILDNRKDRTRADRLRSCRSSAWFARHEDTGQVRVAANACHLRWCPVCAAARRSYISHSVAEWLATASHPKFLTLTLKHTNAPLEHQVTWLYKYFRELRRRKEFARCVTGGIWFFQIKKSDNDSLWHPHLHCVVTGLYLSKHKLHKMWCQVTYGSFVADIRGIQDPQSAANDAARYASCPGTLLGLSSDDACELVDALHGRRTCGTWGTGRAVSLRPAKLEDKSKWHNIGSFQLVLGSQETDANAKAIVKAWQDCQPLPKGINFVDSIVTEFLTKQNKTLWDTVDEFRESERSPP